MYITYIYERNETTTQGFVDDISYSIIMKYDVKTSSMEGDRLMLLIRDIFQMTLGVNWPQGNDFWSD